MDKLFFDFLNSSNLLFEPRLVNNFLLSLKTKPFVILTGNSGTGKTRLALSFAKWVYENYYLKPRLCIRSCGETVSSANRAPPISQTNENQRIFEL